MTASFYSKVGIFHTSEALNLTITFALRIAKPKAKTPAHRMCGRPRPPTWSWGGTPSSKVKSDGTCDASVIVIEIISHLCLKPLKQVVQLLAARPSSPRPENIETRTRGARWLVRSTLYEYVLCHVKTYIHTVQAIDKQLKRTQWQMRFINIIFRLHLFFISRL